MIQKHFTEERLALAWVRANGWTWDEEVLGPKPDGYDELPMNSEMGESKYSVIDPRMIEIERELVNTVTSKYWWIYQLGRTEKEWEEWWLNGDGSLETQD